MDMRPENYNNTHVINRSKEKEIRLADSSVITREDLINRVNNGETLFSYFRISDELIMDKVTPDNVSLVGEFYFGISDNFNGMTGYLMIYYEYDNYVASHHGHWRFAHRVADEYNIRTGAYGKLLEIDYIDPSDYPNYRHHKDGNPLNNVPSNITRLSHRDHDRIHREELGRISVFGTEEYIEMDYYRKLARSSRHHEAREYGRMMSASVKMKDKYNCYITEDFYNDHKYEFTQRPARWSRLLEVFNDTDGINDAINSYTDDLRTIYDKNQRRRIRIYLASGFFCDDDRSLVSFMEAFLEARGYEVYSPSRDGIVLDPNATQEDRNRVFQENVINIQKSDLVVVLVNNKDTGTSTEVGMTYGYWYSYRNHLLEISQTDPDILSESDKLILDQECPRMISFSDNGTNLNIMLLGAVMKHTKSFQELAKYLDYIDEVGIESAKRDPDSINSVKVY